jgi:hypothetical protein
VFWKSSHTIAATCVTQDVAEACNWQCVPSHWEKQLLSIFFRETHLPVGFNVRLTMHTCKLLWEEVTQLVILKSWLVDIVLLYTCVGTMVAASKNSRFKEIMPELGCKEIYHPLNPTCHGSMWDLYQSSLKGSAQIFASLYTVSHLDVNKC